MDAQKIRQYTDILKEELIPAMGCTEPIAIAYTASAAAECAKRELGADGLPDRVEVNVSSNIIKNVKSVTVPNTGGLKGIEAAAAAGILFGKSDLKLEVLSSVDPGCCSSIERFAHSPVIKVSEAVTGKVLFIETVLWYGKHRVTARTEDSHTGLCYIAADDKIIRDEPSEQIQTYDSSILNIKDIIEYADSVPVEDIEEVLMRQVEYNCAIAKEGMSGKYGAAIGRTLLMSYGNNVYTRAKAWAAAGSDARMAGCDMPVIINSGSGNQGMAASLPVIVYARELKVSDEIMLRALAVSNLTAIHLKSGIGCLSAYCGATSAGCGAGAGIMYLHGGRLTEIAHTIVNAIAINSGVVCDGAKASCAAKISSAVESGLLGMQMYMHGKEFFSGEGIVSKGVENTIRNVGLLARNGMAGTDREIVRIMLGEN